jgi:hypothetical protein
MSCNDEHHDHSGHDHDHSHGAAHDHSDDITPALQNLLYDQIDFQQITTLNEEVSNSGRAICQKTWAERMNPEPELQSSADEQLLMTVPFTGQVRLHSILLRTSAHPSAPRTLKLFLNESHLDFEMASEKTATQTLTLSQTSSIQEIPVKRAFFNTTRSLALFFEDNFGDGDEDVTRIGYIGFKGDFMKLNKEAVSVLYESAANPADHKAIVGTGQAVGRSVQ